MAEMKTRTTFKVVKILSLSRIVINAGRSDGIKVGNKIVLYEQGEEIIDPDTGENLGALEIVKGNGVVKHVQDKMSTVHGFRTSIKKQKSAFGALGLMSGQFPSEEVEEFEDDFDNPKMGDLAKRI